MDTLILTLHIIVCILLVILVLLQSGKEGMGVIFGGGNSSVFGSTGAGGILAKLTALMAVIFVITSLSYTYVTSSRTSTESEVLNVRIEEPLPAATSTVPEKGQPEQAQPSPAETGNGTSAPAQPEKTEQPANPDNSGEQTGAAPQQ